MKRTIILLTCAVFLTSGLRAQEEKPSEPRAKAAQPDFRQGALTETDRSLDVAINGKGFFGVEDPFSGEIFYTRAGNFSVDPDGNLVLFVNNVARRLEPAVTIPHDVINIHINPDGSVWCTQPPSDQLQRIGDFQLSTFNNPEGLFPLGDNLFEKTSLSGSPKPGTPGLDGVGELRQYHLEQLTNTQVSQAFNGIGVDASNMHLLSNTKTRSISPENFTGEKGKAGMSVDGPAKGAARDLGQGWKVSPYVIVPAKETFTLAEIEGSGAIQQIWLTPAPLNKSRTMILRFYWDGEETPSIECPLADFFTCGWQEYCQNNSLMVNVNPGSAFNCYWNMPFRKKAKITIENLDENQIVVYYQINYALGDVPDNAAYLHAQFRRVNRLKAKDVVTILDGVKGKGHYVGTYMAWEVYSPGWWGEGEIKFFMDGDTEFPTICGTGTEDYFCGSYNFDRGGLYREFSTPYAGLVQVIPNDVCYKVGQRFGLYRWHVTDPIRFDEDLKVTMQALGWYDDKSGRYLPLEDDISSVAFWYQAEPHAPFPQFPSKEELQFGPLKVVKP